MEFIDSHAHLTAKEFDEDREEVIARAIDAGISRIVNPAVDLEDSRRAIALADKHPSVYAAVGVHPHQAARMREGDLREIDDLCRHPKVVAIGEIGLDYFYDFAPKDVQVRVFSEQIKISQRQGLPIIIHTRDSIAETVEITRAAVESQLDWCGGSPYGVYHCFSGDGSMAEEVLRQGFLISFPGIITFKKPGYAVEVASKTSIDKMMLETDSPYLSPAPFRGTRNEPARIPAIALRLAEVKGLTVEQIAEQTNLAAGRLFKWNGSSLGRS